MSARSSANNGGPGSLVAIAGDAGWLAHRYDPTNDLIHFLPVPRVEHDRATFLTDEYLPAGLTPTIFRRSDAMAAAPQPSPIHFVFHSAYCCSTLVARAFNRPGWAMSLKEPMILQDIVGWRHRGGRGPIVTEVMDNALSLLARPFETGESVVVKPSNVVNGLAAPMLTLRPEARALLLYAPLKTYLGSIAKKGLDGRLWVRTLLLRLVDEKLIDLGFTARDYLGHTDLQVAAVGWLAQHVLFAKLIAQFGDQRIRTLDSATLTARPTAAMAAIATLFRLPNDDRIVDQIVAGPAFNRHSKYGNAFDAGDRASEHRDAIDVHGDEIEKVAVWTEAVASSAGFSTVLPAALIAANVASR